MNGRRIDQGTQIISTAIGFRDVWLMSCIEINPAGSPIVDIHDDIVCRCIAVANRLTDPMSPVGDVFDAAFGGRPATSGWRRTSG